MLSEYRTWLRITRSSYLSPSTHGRRSLKQRRYRHSLSSLDCIVIFSGSWFITHVQIKVQRTDCDSDHIFHIGISCAYCTGQVDDDGEEVKEEEVKEGADEEKKEVCVLAFVSCFLILTYFYCLLDMYQKMCCSKQGMHGFCNLVFENM